MSRTWIRRSAEATSSSVARKAAISSVGRPDTMQRAGALDLVELALDFGHAVADQAPIGLDLGFAGTAKEAEAAALALEVGPAPDQPPRLIIEMRELDLHAAFGSDGALAEN